MPRRLHVRRTASRGGSRHERSAADRRMGMRQVAMCRSNPDARVPRCCSERTIVGDGERAMETRSRGRHDVSRRVGCARKSAHFRANGARRCACTMNRSAASCIRVSSCGQHMSMPAIVWSVFLQNQQFQGFPRLVLVLSEAVGMPAAHSSKPSESVWSGLCERFPGNRRLHCVDTAKSAD